MPKRRIELRLPESQSEVLTIIRLWHSDDVIVLFVIIALGFWIMGDILWKKACCGSVVCCSSLFLKLCSSESARGCYRGDIPLSSLIFGAPTEELLHRRPSVYRTAETYVQSSLQASFTVFVRVQAFTFSKTPCW